MSVTGKREYSVKSVENALDVLEAFGDIGEEVRLSHLSQKLNMDKSKIFRLLTTFARRGYVEQEKETGKYRLGLAAYEVGQKFLGNMTLWRKAKPMMERLARECDEATYLVVSRREEILMLDMVDTTKPVGIMPLVGKRYPSHQNAAGRILQAYNFEAGESHAVKKTALPEERESLHDILQLGFSADVGSLGDGVSCLAVPLLNARKRALGCLCFVGPQFRFTEEKVQADLLPLLKTAGKTVSAQLGYPAHRMS